MGKYLSVIRTLLVILLTVAMCSCGSTGGEGTDEDSNIVSEIDEATSDISDDEGGDEESLQSEGGDESADEEFASEYEDEEKGDEAAAEEGGDEGEEVAEGEEEGGEKAEGEEEFADEDFQDEDFEEEGGEGEEVAEGEEEGFDDFEEGEEEGGDREVAQEGGEPTLEALDGSSEEAMNEPPAKDGAAAGKTAEAGGEGGDYPDAQVENPEDVAAAPTEVAEGDAGGGEVASQGWVPVKKIKDAPFYKNGRLLNAVYIFRTDTDLASVSQKIFGEDRSAQLLEDNPHLGRGAKTGDKLYYNSPSRPTDSTTMKVAYEDVGQVAQEYVTKVGDNIRTFSDSLLGFPDAWKEVWATNASVESKDEVGEGLALRYWKDDLGSLNTNLASNNKTPELDAAAASAASEFNAGGAAGATGNLPPPPPPPGGSDFESGLQDMASNNQLPPPPPPPVGAEAPVDAAAAPGAVPPAPGLAAGDKHGAPGVGGLGALGGDSSMMIYVALGLLAAVALFIKKKKSARSPSVFEATQV